jgi:hypothetical protein
MRVVKMSVLVTAVVAVAGLGVASAGSPVLAAPARAAAPGASAHRPHAGPAAGNSVTLASGQIDVNGFDTNTSLCYQPDPAPVTVADDPENPACAPLPLASSAVNPYVITHPSTAWIGPLNGSQWVGPEPTGSDTSEDVPAYYVYDRAFTGCGEVSGQAYADNEIGIFLNGKRIGLSNNAVNFQPPPVPFAGVANGSGTNVIDFVVWDASPSLTGLDYSFKVTHTACSSYTLSSGITADQDQGFDTNTSFCYDPKPRPSLTHDPVNPECHLLPKQKALVPNPYIVNPAPAGWPAPYPGTQWVGPQSNGGDNLEHAGQWYIYDAEFPGCAKFKINAQAIGQLAVFLNNGLLAPPPVSGLTTISGNNVIDFVVHDTPGPTTGLDYSVTVTPVPCPVNPWGSNPGGSTTGSARQMQLTDTTTGKAVSCTSAADSTFKAGAGLPGTDIASVKKLSFAKCTGPLGLTMKLTGGDLPYALNAVSYNPDVGVTAGTITGVHLALSGPGCTAVADGKSGTAGDGRIAISYSNSLGALTAVAAGSTLHFWDVKGCAGLFTSGDAATLTGTYTLSPPQTLTSS